MSEMWFSTMLRFITSVEGAGPTTYVRSVFVFRAPDWESANRRALDLGKASEETYLNADAQHVTRQLMRVETLDLLGDEIVDGREVYSEPEPVGDEVADKVELLSLPPEDFEPTQSGV